MKAIKNDYDTNVMYDIAKVAGKLHIFVSHSPIDLSTVLIPNDGSLEESFAGIISEETKIKQRESLRELEAKATLANQLLCNLWKLEGGLNSLQGRDEKKRLDHLKQDQEMLVIKVFSERKKVFRERKKCEKIRAKRSDFLQGMK
ncbi:hypothetical protein Tco_0917582 [Tanacetum coccineum]